MSNPNVKFWQSLEVVQGGARANIEVNVAGLALESHLLIISVEYVLHNHTALLSATEVSSAWEVI